ncbi:MAG: ATP-binding cassette domain-containing protein [Thermomicrobiaceae bacterium]|nr:ATP-binding cassette domain-containing protein [Thermomicrobiaceae bacterium]
MDSIVEVGDLVKRFGDFVAVDHVSFAIPEGEIFGLLGPNGAGKTTTIRVLATLLPPTSGVVRVAGLDVQREGARVRQLLGYVPQTLSADGSLTGYENLLIVAKLLGLPRAERRERIEEVLALMRLEDAADRLVREYSGGMVRRLEVGQAILHRPRLLILDEPTVGLDPTARRSVWETIEQLRAETDLTVLVTTHYMEEADAYCDRVAIMDHGRIAVIGTPEELKAGIGRPGSTLEDVFVAVTGNTLESGGTYRELRQLRRRVQRFG